MFWYTNTFTDYTDVDKDLELDKIRNFYAAELGKYWKKF